MPASSTTEELTRSLQRFKELRDALLHEDASTFNHHLSRFVALCKADPFVQPVLASAGKEPEIDSSAWLNEAYHNQNVSFPDDLDEELLTRWRIIQIANEDDQFLHRFGMINMSRNRDAWVETFRVIVVRPFASELTRRLADAANIANREARDLQAVPLNRIPSLREVRIFLSHKSADKPRVTVYYEALKELGFEPWLDERDMHAGVNLERGLLQGFEESCAAVFFITENYVDENYLATEVEYAVVQKRKKGHKFNIITLRYSDAAQVPGLLQPYIHKYITNDLQGFHELVRALPIELGPVRWKERVL